MTSSPPSLKPHAQTPVGIYNGVAVFPEESWDYPGIETVEAGDQVGTVSVADSLGDVPPFPHLFKHPLKATGWLIRTTFGIATLIVALAVVAAIPIVNFLALGYLMEVEARVARTGKLRYAFPLLDVAPRIGSIVIGITFWVGLFTLLVASPAADAMVIDPGGPAAQRLRSLTTLCQWVLIAHLCLALARGGSFGCFLRPLKNVLWMISVLRKRTSSGKRKFPWFWLRHPVITSRRCPMCGEENALSELKCEDCGEELPPLFEETYWEAAEYHVKAFVKKLRLGHHFLLGLRGAAGAFLWLVLPTLLFASTTRSDSPMILLTLLGGVLLMWIFSWLPFLQARFAASSNQVGSLAIFKERKEIRTLFRQAPIAFLIALLLVYAMALPFYLAKVRLAPRDALWMVTIIYIVTMYPARVATGWAYHRATKREKRAWTGWVWLCRLLMLPILFLFVFLLFFTQGIGEAGKGTLYEHHAFLVPFLFFGS